jgi:hypothetical protein
MNLFESLSPYIRRRLSYDDLRKNIDHIVDYTAAPAWFSQSHEFVAEVCDILVNYLVEDFNLEDVISPSDKDELYNYFVDTFGSFLVRYYNEKKSPNDKLNEEIGRIRQVMGIYLL